MTRFASAAALVLLFLTACSSVAPAGASFIGNWSTQWQTLDGAGIIAADLVVTLDTTGDRTLVDGEYTTIDATTKLPVKGWMHGELSATGNVWSGTWWNAAPHEHGTFTFTLTGETTFTGTYTQAQHGRKTFAWNGTRN
ncbi:MAG TPA: hypothetical protein VF911_21680 [Thermoanaerobaculia bacterium]|jgi:hypothetical protein